MSITRTELQDAVGRAFRDGGLAPDAAASWQMLVDLGCLAMTLPEAKGGLGLGAEASAVVHAELGRSLVPGGAIGQSLAVTALAAADDLAERDALLERALAGDVFAAPLGGFRGTTAIAVADADRASHLLWFDNAGVFLVPLDSPGVTITPRTSWDEGRRLFDVDIGSAARLALASGNAAPALSAQLQSALQLALAADSLGGAAAILEITVAYLETRRQFDRPLAMYQALKHRCADMKTWLVAAEALLWQVAGGTEDSVATGALKAHATEVYAAITEEAVQLHGGIGLTAEHQCHLFLKRSLLNQQLGGHADDLTAAVGRRVLQLASGGQQ